MHLRTDTGRQSHFAQVPMISKPRNAFGVAEKHITTMQFDGLFPLWHKFIYPGDTLSVTQKLIARLQTQNGVLYDDLYVDIHAWFVPHRLTHPDWARFQFNAQPLGPTQDNSALVTPSLNISSLPGGQILAKSTYDYFGYPTLVEFSSDEHLNNYLGRAYNLIWNENYRDENLQNAVPTSFENTQDAYNDFAQIRKRGKRHDKFTSGLTSQQKGPAVTVPFIGGDYNVTSNGNPPIFAHSGDGSALAYMETLPFNGTNFPAQFDWQYSAPTSTSQVHFAVGEDTGLRVDLSSTALFTINQFRQSVAVQHLLEADARGGTRDVESILHRWGVTVPDFRLQRPEYLGGTTFSFDGIVVPQTSASADTPQGHLAQFSQAMNAFNVQHSFQEHGVVIFLASARSNLTYQQGLHKELSYKTRFDFYQPEFANLGEVAVKNKELFYTSNDSVLNNATLSFQEYAYEMRYGENRVTGEMRSNHPESLDMRHMAFDFASLPSYSGPFIESFTPISRNIAVSAQIVDPIEISTIVEGRIARTLPMYSVPGLTRL